MLFLLFEIWSILYSEFVVYWSGTSRDSENILCWGGGGGCGFAHLSPLVHGGLGPPNPQPRPSPPGPDAFVLNPPRHLVIGYHWLAFLNQVRNQAQTNSLQMLNTKFLKSIISQKLKTVEKKIPRTKKSVSEHCPYFGMFFSRQLFTFFS